MEPDAPQPVSLLGGLLDKIGAVFDAVSNAVGWVDIPNPGERPAPGKALDVFAPATGYDEVHWRWVDAVASVHDAAAWNNHFAAHRGGNARFTLRGGGCTFDRKALGRRVLHPLPLKADIAVQGDAVTVGPAARWRDVLRAMLAQGLYPRSVNTSSRATVGGTVAADCLSRFSTFRGREGDQVLAFELLTPAGVTHTCRVSEANANSLEGRLFRAAISGFGMLGAFASITFRGDRLALDGKPVPASGLAFKTRFDAAQDFTADPAALHALLAKLADPAGDGLGAARFANLWYTLGGLHGVYGESALVQAPPKIEPNCLPFAPYVGPKRFAMETLAATVTAALSYVQDLYFRQANNTFYDPIEDYTFFMDGNDLAKQRWAAVNRPLRLLQQTFMIPARDGAALDTNPAAAFIVEARARATALKLYPPMHDVLYIPKDKTPFVLSATRDMDAFAVTFAFEALDGDGAWAARVASLFKGLSVLCAAANGRVHLVKDVIADDAVLQAMYKDAVPELRALRLQVDPEGQLWNEIGERLGVL